MMAANSFNPTMKLVVGLASVTAVAALAGTFSTKPQGQGTAGGTTALNVAPQGGFQQQPRQFQHQEEEEDDDDDAYTAVVPQTNQRSRNQQSGQAGTLPRTRSKRS